jgi:hypothetical protein
MTRSLKGQLFTAKFLLAQFITQIAEYEATGANADRIDGLREGKATWEQRVADLEGRAE